MGGLKLLGTGGAWWGKRPQALRVFRQTCVCRLVEHTDAALRRRSGWPDGARGADGQGLQIQQLSGRGKLLRQDEVPVRREVHVHTQGW
eukprot:1160128-Pelagomonas_calceolata.AAC.5